jgi:hypothetical protein
MLNTVSLSDCPKIRHQDMLRYESRNIQSIKVRNSGSRISVSSPLNPVALGISTQKNFLKIPS